jgi:hypothetical protein
VSLGVGEGLAQGRLTDAECLCGDGDPPTVERPHRDPEALARIAEQRIRPEAHVFEIQVHTPEAAHAE